MKNKSYLLDTNIFIWAMEKNPRLSAAIVDLLEDSNNPVLVSVVSIWEIVIKRKKTPLKVPRNIIKGIESTSFSILPIEASHVIEIEKLPDYHKDPFDRVLIAQARVEKLTLISSDKKFRNYDLKLLRV